MLEPIAFLKSQVRLIDIEFNFTTDIEKKGYYMELLAKYHTAIEKLENQK